MTGDLATVGPADVVILGVKAHALTGLAPTLRPLFGPDTVVVSTQNGIPWWYFQNTGGELNDLRLERVDPGGVISGAIEHRRVVGSLAYFATDLPEPGVVRHIEGNRISFGEPDGTKSERAKRIADALIAAGMRCPVTARFRHEIWVKLLGNVAFNPISALTGGTLEELARHPDGVAAGAGADGRDRGGGRQARHRAADLDRPADGRGRESRRAQDLDAAGLSRRDGRWSSKRWSARWWNSAIGWACRCRARRRSTPARRCSTSITPGGDRPEMPAARGEMVAQHRGRRCARIARRDDREYRAIFEGGATMRGAMQRRPNAGTTFTPGC